MRIIDADALKKHYAWWEDDRQKLFDSIVDQQPTVDAVQVIRCKDCVYYRQYADGRYDCDNLYGIADAHKGCFCSRAERRKDNG